MPIIQKRDCAFWRGCLCNCTDNCLYSTPEATMQTSITREEEYEAFTLMKATGGHFASSLAEAWFHADLENQEKIRKAFLELISSYVAQIKE